MRGFQVPTRPAESSRERCSSPLETDAARTPPFHSEEAGKWRGWRCWCEDVSGEKDGAPLPPDHRRITDAQKLCRSQSGTLKRICFPHISSPELNGEDLIRRLRLSKALSGLEWNWTTGVKKPASDFDLKIASLTSRSVHADWWRHQNRERHAGIWIWIAEGRCEAVSSTFSIKRSSCSHSTPQEVSLIWSGGLPQRPADPWEVLPCFSISLINNEVKAKKYFIRQWQRSKRREGFRDGEAGLWLSISLVKNVDQNQNQVRT